MQGIKTRLPEGLSGIAKLMELDKAELRAWPYYKEVVNLFKDYNFGVLKKEKLIEKLSEISAKSRNDGGCYFAMAVETLEGKVKVCY